MAKWGIPQLFKMWRKSVLFTVGAISLGAEELETQLGRLLKKQGAASERAPRVKVPVRPVARPARVVPGKKARAGRKVAVKGPKADVRMVRKVKAAAVAAPVTVTASSATL